MFLEFCGKLCFSRIRPSFFYALLLIPFILSGSFLLSRHSSQQQLEARFADATKKGKAALQKKTRKEKFIYRYSKSGPFFLDRQIEALSFLEKEQETLQSMIQHPAVQSKRMLKERLEFLTSEANRLVFTEENIRTSSQIKETEEKQRLPVQMSEEDLQRLLTAVEDLAVGQNQPLSQTPQLLVRDMKIKKIENPLHSEVYEVEMELLKREWSTP